MSELHIACAADARYVGHSAAMLHSVLTAGGEEIVVHYLHGADIPSDVPPKLDEMFARHGARIEFHEIRDARLARLPVLDSFGAAMWYRIALPELLPQVDTILYLDIDTIVCDRLEPLWELELDGRYLAAVTNVCMTRDLHRPTELGLDLSRYFNSGVLLMNLELMRQDGFTERLVARVGSANGSLVWPDQDALNLLAATRRLELHPRWNYMNSFMTSHSTAIATFGERALEEATRAPAIRHFEGPGVNKPWHVLHDPAGQSSYREHRLATPWPHYQPDGAIESAPTGSDLRFQTDRGDVRVFRRSHPLGYIVRELPARLQAMARDLRSIHPRRILDYGCADLPYRHFFDDAVEYLAADLPGNPDASITLEQDGTVPVPDASIDAVLSTQVLEHVRDPQLYLRECHRVLRPGGRLLLSTHGLMAYHPDPVDFWRWTSAGLLEELGRAGFRIIRFEGIMGLTASGLQLAQDGALRRLPPRVAPLVAFMTQSLIAFVERREPAGSRAQDALVFALVAEKPSGAYGGAPARLSA